MFLAMAKVVLEVVLLIFQGVEGFVLDLPPAAAHFHDLVEVGFGELDLGNPREGVNLTFAVGELIVEHVDSQIRVALVQGQIVGIAEAVDAVLVFEDMGLEQAALPTRLKLAEEALVAIGLDRNDELPSSLLSESLDERTTGIEGIEDKDKVLIPIQGFEVVKEPMGGISLTIIFGGTILLDDGFVIEHKDLLLIRAYHSGTQHRMIVGGRSIPMLALHTVRAVDLLGAKMLYPIHTHHHIIAPVAILIQDTKTTDALE